MDTTINRVNPAFELVEKSDTTYLWRPGRAQRTAKGGGERGTGSPSAERRKHELQQVEHLLGNKERHVLDRVVIGADGKEGFISLGRRHHLRFRRPGPGIRPRVGPLLD